MFKTLFLFFLLATFLPSAERPNILWITSEDNDKYWLGCYGNAQAQTPHLDALAKRSARFEHFYSNAPVCAVARSTIITGVYAPSQGTQHMRSRHAIPATHRTYVSYLREAGYYCSNASKTDFNFQGDDNAIWDECGKKAHYRNRATDQPFFAIFNLTESHESSLFPDKIASRRKKGEIPSTPRLDPKAVKVPPYLPDLPEVRSDIAIYHDNITLLDSHIGELLQNLEKEGLAEDTIVFYYADHGGVTPRGKRYLHDTGVNVPLLIHTPAKWKHLSPFSNGSVSQKPLAFIDLAPTLLSLIGVEKPAPMQGRAFLGTQSEQSDDNYVFLFADRFDEIYGMRRGLTDGRWKYIRRFTPHNPAAPYSYYQFGQAAWKAWRKAWQKGLLEDKFNQIWERNQIVEELYDTQSDQWEINNLANTSAHRAQLEKMRTALQNKMGEVLDSGLIPEPFFAELSPKQPIAQYVAAHKESWPALVELSFRAGERKVAHLPLFLEKLSSPSALERYWALQGCLILGKESQPAVEALHKLLTDQHSANRTAAAQCLLLLGEKEATLPVLIAELSRHQNEYAQQYAMNVFTELDLLHHVTDAWVQKYRSNAGRLNYVNRLANKLAKERGL